MRVSISPVLRVFGISIVETLGPYTWVEQLLNRGTIEMFQFKGPTNLETSDSSKKQTAHID